MATFSINQVRHFYVASATNTVTPKGNKESFKLEYVSPGGKVCSDLINTDNILYATYTTASDMQPKFKTVTITVTKAIVGQEYVIKVLIPNYAGAGDDNYTVKYGMYTAESGDDASKIAAGLRASLTANMKDLVKLPAIGGTGANITITEVKDDYEVGVKPFRIIKVDEKNITLFAINDGSVETTKWATITESAPAAGSDTNGYLIADLEWFHTGARGDMYRGYGHPHGVRTKLVADPSVAYDTIDIHYAYVGPNEGAQKSEKTITVAGTAAQLTSVKDALVELGFLKGQTDSKTDTDVLPAKAE